MLDPEIADAEKLFRAVPNVPSHWNPETKSYSSSIFKDKRGVSVDREGGRTMEDVIARLENTRQNLGAIVSITAGACREIGTHPVYRPLPDNVFHCEIHESDKEERISSSKAKRLSRAGEVVFYK